jgi:uncharacterized protein
MGTLSEAQLRQLCDVSAPKLAAMRAQLRGFPSALVAFSGGADSALVLKVAVDELGERAVALTAVSPSLPPREREGAEAFCKALGVRHLLIASRELEDPSYAKNPDNRCYFCKDELYGLCEAQARELGLETILDGFNADDRHDHRPGHQAAREHAVRSPLAEAELTKDEVRAHSWALGLPTWDKPAMPCLASRLPTGTPVTLERLAQVGGAEEALRDLGFRVFRVRYHGEVARIEVAADELERLLDMRSEVSEALKRAGFRFVAVDLEPYRSGRLSERTSART